MENVQHFLQFLFPDLPCHENCWCSPQPLPGLCAVAAGSVCLLLSSAGGGKWPKGAFRNSSGSLEDSPDSTEKSSEDIRDPCFWWSLWICSACFSHSYTTCKSTGVLQRDVLSWRKEKPCRGHGGKASGWRWTFPGTEMTLQQTCEAQHPTALCTTTNFSPSSRFLWVWVF